MNLLNLKNKLLSPGNLLVVFSLATLLACLGGSEVENQYLGKLPSIEKQYYQRIEAKKEELKKSTDQDEAFKLAKEEQLLKEERSTKVEEYLKNAPLKGKELPFQALTGTHYTIEKVEVNRAQQGNLNLKFTSTLNKVVRQKYGSIQKRLTIYFKAVDADGKEIPNTKTVATNAISKKPAVGVKMESFGSWTSSKLVNLETFAKVVEISHDEYKKK